MQMLHPDGHAPARPVEVPVPIAALGPKGNKVAVNSAMPVRHLADAGVHDRLLRDRLPAWGTVLDEAEPDNSEHAREAAGPGWALSLHGAYEFGGPTPCAPFPAATSAEGHRACPIAVPPRRAHRSLRCAQYRGRGLLARWRQQHAPGRHAERNP